VDDGCDDNKCTLTNSRSKFVSESDIDDIKSFGYPMSMIVSFYSKEINSSSFKDFIRRHIKRCPRCTKELSDMSAKFNYGMPD